MVVSDNSNLVWYYTKIMNSSRILLLLIGDTLCFIGALILMLVLDTQGPVTPDVLALNFTAFGIPFVLGLISFYITDLYDIRRSIPSPRTVGRFALSIAIFGGLSVVFFYIFPGFGITPKMNLVILSTALLLAMILWRRLFFLLFASTFARTILFIGTDPEIKELKDALLEHRHVGTSVGTLTSMAEYNPSIHTADLIVLSRNIGTTDIDGVSKAESPIMTVRSAFEEMFGKTPLTLLSKEEVFSLLERAHTSSDTILNRSFEIIVSVLVLVITSPVSILAIVARLIEDGKPLFIRQARVGKNGKIFTLYKFRSMKALAPDGSAEISGAQWAEKKRFSHYTSWSYSSKNTHRRNPPNVEYHPW